MRPSSFEQPFEGDYTQENYAQQMIDEYKAGGIEPAKVWAQSFNLADVEYWIAAEPDFGEQAVFLEDRFDEGVEDPDDPTTWSVQMADLVAKGVEVVAPPMWVLVTLENGVIVPSNYAHEANAAGLDIITWTLERSGLLTDGGGYYYQVRRDVLYECRFASCSGACASCILQELLSVVVFVGGDGCSCGDDILLPDVSPTHPSSEKKRYRHRERGFFAIERSSRHSPSAPSAFWFCFVSYFFRYCLQSVADSISKDADMLTMLDVLARDVGVIGVFTDWPATVTHYANCVLDFLD